MPSFLKYHAHVVISLKTPGSLAPQVGHGQAENCVVNSNAIRMIPKDSNRYHLLYKGEIRKNLGINFHPFFSAYLCATRFFPA